MAEEHVVHEHHDGGNNAGLLIGVILIVVLLFVLFYWGLPFIRGGGTSVTVPDQIDVNVNRGQ